MRRKLLVSLVVCVSLLAPVAFAQQFSSVEERMSSADFKAAGLDKLSPEELANLNAFIRKEVDAKTAQARQEGIAQQDRADAAKMGFRDYNGDRSIITTAIAGDFRGWDGSTSFTLENGQVWKQIDGEQFSVHLQSPAVEITPGLLGVWYLKVLGYGSTTKVERVK